MQIQIQTTRGDEETGVVVTIKADEDAMREIRGYLAERGNDEIRAIFDQAEITDNFHGSRETGETVDDADGNPQPVLEAVYTDAYLVTLPQAAREPFVSVLSGIGADDHSAALSELLDA